MMIFELQCECQNAVMLVKKKRSKNNPKRMTKPMAILSCLNCQPKGRTKK